MSFDLQKLETSAQHFGHAFGSFLTGVIHAANALAPLAQKAAPLFGADKATMADINKAAEVAGEANAAVDAVNQG